MNDKNKDTPDFHEDEHNEFEDTFEDAFEIDDVAEHDPLAQEEIEARQSTPDDKMATTTRSAKKSGSLLPVVIGMAVFGFLAWKLYGTFFSSSKPSAVSSAPKESIAEVKPTVAPVNPPPMPSSTPSPQPIATESSSLPPLVPAQPQDDLMNTVKNSSEATKAAQTEVIKLQTKLDELDKAYKTKIEFLEKEMAKVNENTTNASRALTNIQRDINTLTATVSQIGNQVVTLQQDEERKEIRRQQTVAKKKSKSVPKADNAASLTVYAIIPGRAWLRNANGKTLSVSEGDPIGEYGTVLKIDASNGVVITTSGTILR